jgi:hypothetical protein
LPVSGDAGVAREVDRMSAPAVPEGRLWWLAAGFGVWCVALSALYALHAIGCAFAWSGGLLRIGLIVVLLAGLLAIAAMWLALARTDPDPAAGGPGAFMHAVIIGTLIAAFVTTLLTLAPALLLATCI